MKDQSPVGMLTLVCSATGGEINTGAIYHRDELRRGRKAQVLLRCSFCGKSHVFKFSDARLNPIRSVEMHLLDD
jgi:hypothetical protein